MSEQWVVVLDTEPWAIGPFDSYENARLYQTTDHEQHNMRTMQLLRPAKNWRKEPNVVRGSR